jgi:hypothetical protein
MEQNKVYGVWAVRSAASIFGRAESWCKEDGKPLEFESKKRIPGVAKFSRMWLIPKDAEKPVDGRLKRT